MFNDYSSKNPDRLKVLLLSWFSFIVIIIVEAFDIMPQRMIAKQKS
jgi:hypothetical protein